MTGKKKDNRLLFLSPDSSDEEPRQKQASRHLKVETCRSENANVMWCLHKDIKQPHNIGTSDALMYSHVTHRNE